MPKKSVCFARVLPADTSARAGLRPPCLSQPVCSPCVDMIDLPRQALWSGRLRGILSPRETEGVYLLVHTEAWSI